MADSSTANISKTEQLVLIMMLHPHICLPALVWNMFQSVQQMYLIDLQQPCAQSNMFVLPFPLLCQEFNPHSSKRYVSFSSADRKIFLCVFCGCFLFFLCRLLPSVHITNDLGCSCSCRAMTCCHVSSLCTLTSKGRIRDHNIRNAIPCELWFQGNKGNASGSVSQLGDLCETQEITQTQQILVPLTVQHCAWE